MKSKLTFAISALFLFNIIVNAQIRVTTNNNVGIGNMTNPVSLLELENNKWMRLNSLTGTAGILFYKSGTSTATSVQYGGQLYYDGTLDQLRLGTVENNAFKESLDIKRSTGEVGMGISPLAGYQLYVKGKTMIWGDEFSYCTYNGNPYPRIIFNNNNYIYAELGAYPTTPVGQLGTTAHQWSQIRGVSIYANEVFLSSDARLKENIITIDKSLLKVSALRPVKYDFKPYEVPAGEPYKSEVEKINNRLKNRTGFLAQEVMEVMPEVVQYDAEDDAYYIDYAAIIPQLVGAMQEQQKQIQELKDAVELLKSGGIKN